MNERISPTAHYTGQIWVRNNVSIAAMDTWVGRMMYYTLMPYFFMSSKLTGGYTLEHLLLQRHYTIDHLLEKAITSGHISQVFEIAAGLSGRGCRFAKRYQNKGLSYYEGDLPSMMHIKQKKLKKNRIKLYNHHLIALDALSENGPGSLEQIITSRLDIRKGTAIITEGLLPYLDKPTLQTLWLRIAEILSHFPKGVYISELRFGGGRGWLSEKSLFSHIQRLTVGGGLFYHNFKNENQVIEALKKAQFKTIELKYPLPVKGVPKGPDVFRVIEAWSDPFSGKEQGK